MNKTNLITKTEPLTRPKNNTYDCQLIEAVREDLLKLISKLDEMLAK